MSSSSSTKTFHMQDQYHHYIPRFILRQFRVNRRTKMTCKERRKAFLKEKKNPSLNITDKVLVFDVATGTLDTLPVHKVYGELNLYRDHRNPLNLNHVEQELGCHENQASKVIAKISDSTSRVLDVRMTRKELGVLRQFLFILYLRIEERSNDHNTLHQNLFRKSNKTQDANTNITLVDTLDFILRHPHYCLVAMGDSSERNINEKLQEVQQTFGINRKDIYDPYCMFEYKHFATDYFLGIWEAADHSEFILGSNSFGIKEGSTTRTRMDYDFVHCIHIISPRFAVVLRHVSCLLPVVTSTKHVSSSRLLDIPMRYAEAHYPNFRPSPYNNAGDEGRALLQYLLSDEAEKDELTFAVTKLTGDQTQAVNFICLSYVGRDGAVTFSSKRCMFETLQAYIPWYHSLYPFKGKYSALQKILSSSQIPQGAARTGVPTPNTISRMISLVILLGTLIAFTLGLLT